MKSNEGPANREGKKSLIILSEMFASTEGTEGVDVQHSLRSRGDLEAQKELFRAESRQGLSAAVGHLVHSSRRQ